MVSQIPKRKYDAVIFDIDNVLIDTRASYTDCIRETVQRYLECHLGYKPQKSLFLARRDIEQFKLLGGFNDDWDTTYGLLLYLLHLKSKVKTIACLKKTIRLKRMPECGGKALSTKGAEKRYGKNPRVKMAAIALRFQKLYWSKYIRREALIIPKKLIRTLTRSGIQIGIATGRNRREAEYALKRFGIRRYIKKMVTVSHLPSKKVKKPDPYSLFHIAEAFGKNLRYLYIGDLPDDMRMGKAAASKIKIDACGFTAAAVSPEQTARALKKSGACVIIRHARQLEKMLLQKEILIKPKRIRRTRRFYQHSDS